MDSRIGSTQPSEALSETSRWERGFDPVVAWAPYVALVVATILGQVGRSDAWSDRGLDIALALVAAGWTWIVFTRASKSLADRQLRVRIYFVGFVVLAVTLMLRDPVYFIYVISGFFHSYLLRPNVLKFVGIAITSVVVNSMIVYPNPTAEGWTTFVIVVVIQAVAIGIGGVGGEKISALSEQRRLALADLEIAHEENAALQVQFVAQAREAGILDERQRMAREIHDTLAQGLTGVITQIEAARQVRNRASDTDRHLENAARLARVSLDEARRSVRAMQPGPLDDSRLPDALAEVVRHWSDLNGKAVDLRTTGVTRPLHPQIEVTLLRVCQEGLANIAKHAVASRIGITLSFMDDVVSLDVRDDGVGFVPGSGDGTGFGLMGMLQRVEALNGRLEVESEIDEGTAVSVTIPTPVLRVADG